MFSSSAQVDTDRPSQPLPAQPYLSPRFLPSIRILLLSLIVLIPCFWQRRIQAGDLGSHIYNSWLAQQIQLGKAPGLTLVPLTSNVLFDLSLSVLYRAFGAEPAQRIAVSLLALIFFWGAFAVVCAMSGQRPWFITPCLLMLTYGWTFHMGFFNFYLSAGFSLWALALDLKKGAAWRWAVVALFAVAYTAHVLPLLWAICVIVYQRISQRSAARFMPFLFAAAVCGIVALRFGIMSRYHTQSSFHQILEASAIDQVWVFGIKYCAISVGVAVLWSFLLLRIAHRKGIAGTMGDVSFQLCVLMSIGILLLPSGIELPQLYNIAVSFITERMTLLSAVCICALVGTADPPNWIRFAFVPLALLYFSFLFVDTDALNKVEKRMEDLTASLSGQDRVISSFEDPHCRVQLWAHNLDRVCLGRCISYANYEPFTQQFRVRVVRQNPLVAVNPLDYAKFQAGGYVVNQSDLPFFQIVRCDQRTNDLCLVRLKPGDVTTRDQLSVTPILW